MLLFLNESCEGFAVLIADPRYLDPNQVTNLAALFIEAFVAGRYRLHLDWTRRQLQHNLQRAILAN